MTHVGFDGILRQKELLFNFGSAFALCDERHDFLLARGEAVLRRDSVAASHKTLPGAGHVQFVRQRNTRCAPIAVDRFFAHPYDDAHQNEHNPTERETYESKQGIEYMCFD